jgi:hypothetical protein
MQLFFQQLINNRLYILFAGVLLMKTGEQLIISNFVFLSTRKDYFMKKYLHIVALLITMVSCAPGTKIIHSWRDPDMVINTHTSNKFIVAALLKNETIRRRTEDLMTIYYPKKAVPSYKECGTHLLNEDIASLNKDLISRGFDAVVVFRVVQIDKTHPYVHGIYPAYYNNWKDYYNFAWERYFNPGDYVIQKTYYVEVNVYYLATNKLVWSGTTSTINPSGSDELFDEVINTVNEKMKKEGFLQ